MNANHELVSYIYILMIKTISKTLSSCQIRQRIVDEINFLQGPL